MRHRGLASLLCLLLAPGAVLAASTEQEWKQLHDDHRWIETLRRAVPKVSPEASRREQIEGMLEAHRRLDAVLIPFLGRLENYFERTADPRAAALLARERMRLGDAYLDVLARPDRALEMYRAALELAPEDESVRARITRAESVGGTGEESFATIVPGLTMEEVEALLGRPREDWIRQVVRDGALYAVWIYAKRDGGLASVHFRNGVVYHAAWAAPTTAENGRGTVEPD